MHRPRVSRPDLHHRRARRRLLELRDDPQEPAPEVSIPPTDPANDDRIERLLDEAEQALDAGDAGRAIELCRQVQASCPDHAGAWFVLGQAHQALGRFDRAADAFHRAALQHPDHAPSWSALALARFEQCRFDDAEQAADRAIQEDPDDAQGWWVRSLLLQWRGDEAGARRAGLHAHHLDPEAFPLPPELSDDEIEALVEDVLHDLPPGLRTLLADVAIILDDVPSPETCRQTDPPASPLELLGVFDGASLMERSLEDPWSQLPGRIVLFRRNLARMCRSRDELAEQIRITLFHEVGHFLGLDEDAVADRGLQ
ncbi:MAG: tetratricopeptide repeat protein [Deltaproteobacteria bacterium]|nr:MAG: tetratricopeptide repeat protein [Deltaproteobacteria bacterium]